jgi:hypothetical protein
VTASLNPALRLLLFVKPVLKFRAAILVFRIVNCNVAAELSLRMAFIYYKLVENKYSTG